VHSLARERVNGVCSNTDYWYDLFGVKEGNKLFRKVDERVRIW
jgi:putative endopeptidase